MGEDEDAMETPCREDTEEDDEDVFFLSMPTVACLSHHPSRLSQAREWTLGYLAPLDFQTSWPVEQLGLTLADLPLWSHELRSSLPLHSCAPG